MTNEDVGCEFTHLLLIVARQLLESHDRTRTSPAGARRTRRKGRRGDALRRSAGKRRQASIRWQTQTCALRSESYFGDVHAHILHSVVLFGAARYEFEGAADRDTNA